MGIAQLPAAPGKPITATCCITSCVYMCYVRTNVNCEDSKGSKKQLIGATFSDNPNPPKEDSEERSSEIWRTQLVNKSLENRTVRLRVRPGAKIVNFSTSNL